MEEKLCPLHEDDIISVCFSEGCNQHLLCKECIKSHPDTHNSNTKNIISLMRKDDWIRLNENLRNSQMFHLKSIYYEKESLLSEDQEKLRRMVDEIIESLRSRLSKWINKLSSSSADMNMKAKSDNIESLGKIKDTLDHLENIDFRKGDIYNQLEKAKLFNETILPESMELCKQYQGVFDGNRIKIDQSKLDDRKVKVLKLIRSIKLKDFYTVPVSHSGTLTQPLKKSHEEAKLNSNSEGQSDHLTGLDDDYQQKIESLTVTNKNLQDKIFKLKTGLDSLVEVKLSLQTELEAHKDLIKKFPKAGILSEDSLIIPNKDFDTIRAWIPKPSSLNGSHKLKLNLQYRATQDGFTSEAFQKKVENKAPTIAFIKSKMYGKVFGGYTTRTWERCGIREDYQAFLFSLTYGEKYPIRAPKYAMSGGVKYIMSFGGSQDLQIAEGCDKSANNTSSTFLTTMNALSLKAHKTRELESTLLALVTLWLKKLKFTTLPGLNDIGDCKLVNYDENSSSD